MIHPYSNIVYWAIGSQYNKADLRVPTAIVFVYRTRKIYLKIYQGKSNTLKSHNMKYYRHVRLACKHNYQFISLALYCRNVPCGWWNTSELSQVDKEIDHILDTPGPIYGHFLLSQMPDWVILGNFYVVKRLPIFLWWNHDIRVPLLDYPEGIWHLYLLHKINR